MKTCIICGQTKPLASFSKSSSNADKHDNRCRECKHASYIKKMSENYFLYYCSGKKSECKKKGIPFNLTPEYLSSIWTGICPIYGTPISRAAEGNGSHKSAHLDRIDPSKGYVIGNVAWISGRANRIKYNATAQELRKIADWMERATTIRKE